MLLQSERETQDGMLDDLSTVITHMKEMSMDMNTEIDRYFSDFFFCAFSGLAVSLCLCFLGLLNLAQLALNVSFFPPHHRQAPAIEHLHDDIQELNGRVKRANVRGQRLLRR